MTIDQLRFLRRVGLDPEQVEILEELPKRLKLRDLRSGAIFYIPKEIPKRLGEKNEKGDIDMSQEEMNAMDNEVAGVVNSKKGSDCTAESNVADYFHEHHSKWLDKRERRRKLTAVAWLLVCVIAATALVVALYVPAAMPWIVNIGVICFIVAAAVILDRQLRWRV